MIVSEPGVGERYMLADTDQSGTDKATLSAAAVTVSSGTVTDEAGDSYDAFILDSGLDAGKWMVTYKGSDKNKKNYPCYSFVSANYRGLARDIAKGNPAQAWSSLVSGDLTDMRWSYGLRAANILDSYEYVGNTSTGDAIGWSGSAFIRERSGLTATPVYLYRLQTVYTFD